MLKRNALSEITNVSISRRSSTKPSFSTTKSNDTSTGSNNTDAINPRFRSQSPDNFVEDEGFETAKAQIRRSNAVKAKDKGKAIAVVASGRLLAGRTKTLGRDMEKEQLDRNQLHKEHRAVCLPKTCLVPPPISKKKQHFLVSKQHAMPWDVMAQQRAYFSDVDAFKLLEEEVSDSELD
ncbi:hypothetical protein FRX31_021049 [Thalictrum thalictroides]|uniref:Uncharacterized protein n=1 Tax=Thalictrum thalictroides TaxID=46969 RepID=A0A7J6VZ41_THATH|nr:hypothetical protein FRX31_021049 [Thalictrum thalictroides]